MGVQDALIVTLLKLLPSRVMRHLLFILVLLFNGVLKTECLRPLFDYCSPYTRGLTVHFRYSVEQLMSPSMYTKESMGRFGLLLQPLLVSSIFMSMPHPGAYAQIPMMEEFYEGSGSRVVVTQKVLPCRFISSTVNSN